MGEPLCDDLAVAFLQLDADRPAPELLGRDEGGPTAGERVRDPYEVRLEQELPPGNYRLLVGWYLLSTGQRLPVLDDSGAAVDDKVILPGFVVPESGG